MCRPNLRTMFLLAALVVAGCGDKEADYDSGYSDGYAVGYNTTCQIRDTLIEGDWSSDAYSEGYSAGMISGINACNANQQNSN